MNTVLVLNTFPNEKVKHSSGNEILEIFLNEYRKNNPMDKIIIKNLFDEDLPIIDNDFFLNPKDNLFVDEFINADKYIFANPVYNFFLPTQLKLYIDCICVAKKTFIYTANGPQGLLKNKKALHLQTAGGLMNELGSEYIKSICKFINIENLEQLFIENLNVIELNKQEIIEKAKINAVDLAKKF